MPSLSRENPIDYARLSEFLAALAYPVRLELLDALRFPHTLSELRVTPHRREGGVAPERPAAKQTVQLHLDKLVETDLVRAEEFEQDGRMVPRYLVNAPKLYELTEEMRRLSLRYAGRSTTTDATGTLDPTVPAEEAKGPRLVLVHGLYEGKVFPLDDGAATRGRWVIGRQRGSTVTLDYDPFVSLEHALLTRFDDRYTVSDLESRNGTHVNWAPVDRARHRPLKSGDVVGVGRSHLVFIAE